MKLTKAQLRLLQRFAAAPPGTSLHLASEDRGYHQMPIFRGRMHMPNCPTCGHPSEVIAVSFDCIVALHEKGMIRERLKRSEVFYNDDITPSGRAALEARPEGAKP